MPCGCIIVIDIRSLKELKKIMHVFPLTKCLKITEPLDTGHTAHFHFITGKKKKSQDTPVAHEHYLQHFGEEFC